MVYCYYIVITLSQNYASGYYAIVRMRSLHELNTYFVTA